MPHLIQKKTNSNNFGPVGLLKKTFRNRLKVLFGISYEKEDIATNQNKRKSEIEASSSGLLYDGNEFIYAPAGYYNSFKDDCVGALSEQDLLDKEFVEQLRKTPYRTSSGVCTFGGSWVGALLFIPLGPIAMAIGLVIGALLGFSFSVVRDLYEGIGKLSEAKKHDQKLKSIMRWAVFNLSVTSDPLQIILRVIVEYNALATIGYFSSTARKHLKKLANFLTREDVSASIERYLKCLVQNWENISPYELHVYRIVLDVCKTCFDVLKKRRHPPFFVFMESILASPGIQLLFKQGANLKQIQQIRTCRVMEAIAYADAEKNAQMSEEPHCESSPESDKSGSESSFSLIPTTPKGFSVELPEDQPILSIFSAERSDTLQTVDKQVNVARPCSLKSSDAVRLKARSFDSCSRLFKSYRDLVNFDPELKHQTPISPYEYDFLLEMYDESNSGMDPDWDLCINNSSLRVYRMYKSDSPVVVVKAYVDFQNIPLQVLCHHIRHLPTRMSWDTVFSDYRMIEKNLGGCEIIYNLLKAPFPIANRDFLQWRRYHVDPETGAVLLLHRSAAHPKVPEKSGTIRAETIISGYYITPVAEGKSCQLFILAQTDIKGIIPKWLVNTTAARAPVSWADTLRKACLAYIKVHGEYVPPYSDDV